MCIILIPQGGFITDMLVDMPVYRGQFVLMFSTHKSAGIARTINFG